MKVGDKLRAPTKIKGGGKGNNKVKHAEILTINEVQQNPVKYLDLRRDSVLNSLLVEDLPEVFRDIAESTQKTLKKCDGAFNKR